MKLPLILAGAVFAALNLVAAENLLQNSDFETPGKSWAPHGVVAGVDGKEVVAFSNDNPRGGQACLKVVDRWDNCRPYAVQFFPYRPSPEKQLELKFFARSERPQRFRAGILYNERDEKTGKLLRCIGGNFKVFTATPEWQEFIMTFGNIPEAGNYPNICLAAATDAMPETGVVYFDDVTLTEATAAAANPADKLGLDRTPVNQLNYPHTPADGAVIGVNPPAFAFLPPLDWKLGKYTYRLEYSPDPEFKSAETVRRSGLKMHMDIPQTPLKPGKWFWRYGVEDPKGITWSKSRAFTVTADAEVNPYPDLDQAIARIPKNRPRLYVTPETLPELRNRALNGDLKPVVENIRKILAPHIGKELVKEPDFLPQGDQQEKLKAFVKVMRETRPDQNRMELAAFGYLLTGDRELGLEAKRRVLHFFGWNPDGSTALEHNDEPAMWIMRWGVCSYDWTYDLYTPEERAKIELSILRRLEQNYDHLRNMPFDSNPYSSHPNGYLQILGEAAIELAPEHPELKEPLDYALKIFWTACPTYGTPDGGWNEGPGYWSYTTERTMRFVIEVREATGIDFGNKPFFRNTGYYPLYGWPGRTRLTCFSDGVDNYSQAATLWILAAAFNNPDFLAPALERKQTPPPTIIHNFKDPAKLGKPDLARLPKAKLFEGIGFVAMRNNLADYDNDIGLLFQCNPYGNTSHHHNAQNAILLEAWGEPLAISSGYYDYYGSPHHTKWTWETKSHCAVTFDGGKGQLRGGEAAGKITRFETNDRYDIAVGDAGNAYPGFTAAERKIVHLRPGTYVLYDRCRAPEAHVFEYNLHGMEPGSFDPQGQTATLKMPKASLEVRFYADQPWQMASFDKADVSPEPNKTRPERWHFRASSPAKSHAMDLITVLLPYRTGEQAKLAKTTPLTGENARGVRFEYPDGRRALVGFAIEPDKPAKLDGIEFSSPVLVRN